ncbi:MAG TPA: class I SAM-dependent methyltransferase [Clostridiales bacterium]|nr:class I SAM-dependent methyltransferase [Clostridiales bacterium]
MSSAFGGKPGYKEFAYIYDSLMEDVDYNQWVAFILGIFGKYSFSCGSILDLGCGTGNVTIPLAQKGFSLVGVDASEDMLAIAKDKAMDKGLDILFIQQKMEDLNIPMAFDCLLSTCDCLNYILDAPALAKLLKKLYNILNKGGIFIFDLNTPYRIKNINNNTFIWDKNGIYYVWQGNYDGHTKVCEYYITFFKKEGQLYQRFDEVHCQRAYELNEVLDMLVQAGFSNVSVYDNYTDRKPSDRTERLTFVCSKI